MKKLVLIVAVFLGFFSFTASSAEAQTATAGWNQSEPPAASNAFTYTMKVDTLAATPLTQTCVVAGSGSACTATFPLANPTAVHTYVLTATNSFGSIATTLGPGAPPGTSGFKVQVTVVVTVP